MQEVAARVLHVHDQRPDAGHPQAQGRQPRHPASHCARPGRDPLLAPGARAELPVQGRHSRRRHRLRQPRLRQGVRQRRQRPVRAARAGPRLRHREVAAGRAEDRARLPRGDESQDRLRHSGQRSPARRRRPVAPEARARRGQDRRSRPVPRRRDEARPAGRLAVNGWGVKFDDDRPEQQRARAALHAAVAERPARHRLAGGVHHQPRQVDAARRLGPAQVTLQTPPSSTSGPPRSRLIGRLPQLIVSTILLGGLYALIAVGLTLIFGVMRVVNFAHGEFLMLGCTLAFWAFTLLHFDPYLTLVRVAAALLRASGWVSYRARDEAGDPRLAQRAGVHDRGAVDRAAEPCPGAVDAPMRTFRADRLLLDRVAPGRRGVQSRADRGLRHRRRSRRPRCSRSCAGPTPASHARDRAGPRTPPSLMGIDTDRVYALTWAVGIACVGAAGVLLAPIYPVYPTAGLQFVLIAYIAVVLGGLGDMAGALIAALIIAAVEVIGSYIDRHRLEGSAVPRCSSSPSSSCGPRASSASAAPRRSAREGATGRPIVFFAVGGPRARSSSRDAFLLDSAGAHPHLGRGGRGLEHRGRLRRPDLARPLRVLRAGRLRRGALGDARGASRRGSALLDRRRPGRGSSGIVIGFLSNRLARALLRDRHDRVVAGAAHRRQPLARLHRAAPRASPCPSGPDSGRSASRTSASGSSIVLVLAVLVYLVQALPRALAARLPARRGARGRGRRAVARACRRCG